jgi:hypothetical protein
LKAVTDDQEPGLSAAKSGAEWQAAPPTPHFAALNPGYGCSMIGADGVSLFLDRW